MSTPAEVREAQRAARKQRILENKDNRMSKVKGEYNQHRAHHSDDEEDSRFSARVSARALLYHLVQITQFNSCKFFGFTTENVLTSPKFSSCLITYLSRIDLFIRAIKAIGKW